MPRARVGSARHRKKVRVFRAAKGYRGGRSKLYRTATESVDRAMRMATEHRKTRKRDYRALWIIRVSAGCKANDITYSRFIEGLTKAGIGLNRKMLSEIAIHDPDGFTSLVSTAKAQLN